MEKLYLINYGDNYADEFDIYGCLVINETQLNILEKIVEKTEYFCFYFGTNQEIEYYSSSEIKDAFEINEISQKEYEVLKKFDLDDFGYADNFISQLIQKYVDEIYPEEEAFVCQFFKQEL